MTQSAKYFASKHEALSSNPRHSHKKPGMTVGA